MILSIPLSIWSIECVAINENRISSSPGGTAGEITGLIKTPSSKRVLVNINVFMSFPTKIGIIGVSDLPVLNPASINLSLA